MQRERPPHPPLPAAIQRAHPVAHQEGRAQAALGIVLVRARGPEDGHHRIAHELLDESLVALDRRGHLAEEVGLDRAHFLGIESFAEGREPDQVREEHGDGAAVAVGRGGAEGGGGGAGAPASRAPHLGQNAKSAGASKRQPLQVMCAPQSSVPRRITIATLK